MYTKKEKQVFTYEYDFSVDGGGDGENLPSAMDLRNSGINSLPENLVVEDVVLHVETKVESTTGTATIGDGVDADGFFKDIVNLVAGSYSALDAAQGGDLVRSIVTADDGSDGTVDAIASKKLFKVGADSKPVLTVSTAVLTAGKFKVEFHGYMA